jgi:hypothetical protein
MYEANHQIKNLIHKRLMTHKIVEQIKMAMKTKCLMEIKDLNNKNTKKLYKTYFLQLETFFLIINLMKRINKNFTILFIK